VAKSTAVVLGQAIRSVEALVDESTLSDQELLRRFADRNDQAAFAALVRRYSRMVLGVCRRALPTMQDAEDACQATFLVLARKASAQPWLRSVGNYLYTTARRIASNARLAAQRRARRENLAALPEVVQPIDQVTGRELIAVLDEELDRLPARYREPIVLCYLEGLTRDEVATRLGVGVGTIKTQLERGRKKLGDALTRRGCALGAGLLAVAVTSPARASSPRLVEAILSTVSGSPPASVAALARGVGVNALMNRSLALLVAALSVVWLGIAAWSAWPISAGLAADEGKPVAKAGSPNVKPADSEGQTFTGRVVGPDGKAVTGASIILATVEGEEKQTTREVAKTGADGQFRCVVPTVASHRPPYRVLLARAAGFAADWAELRGRNPSKPIVLHLVKATVTVRGRVLTLEGKPVPRAIVRIRRVQAPDGKNGLKEVYEKWTVSPNEAASLLQKHLFYPTAAGLPEKVTADADGRFVIHGAGDGRLLSLEFSADTIETIIARVAVDSAFDPKAIRPDPKKAEPFPTQSLIGPPLYGPTFTHTARPCRVISGTVFDQKTKQPLAHVAVTGHVPSGWWELGVYTRTDAAGRFRLLGLPNGECNLTFGSSQASKYLFLTRTVRPTTGLAPVTLDMPMVKGTTVTGRVTDKETGKPIKGSIRYVTLSGNKHLLDLPGKEIHADGSMTHRLDRDGRFRFVAPPGLGIVVVQADSWRGEEKPYPQVRIRTEDRAKPYFRTRPGQEDMFITSSGILQILGSYHAYRVIEPVVGAETMTVDVQVDPGKVVAGKVVGPDGKPFSRATFTGLTGRFSRPAARDSDTFTVQALLPDEARTVAVADAGKKLAGTVVVRADAKEPPVVRLAAWGAITGRIVDAEGNPIAGARLRMYFTDQVASDLYRHLSGDRTVTTDAAGRFRCDVPFAGIGFNLNFIHNGKYLNLEKSQQGLTITAGEVKSLGDIVAKSPD
jgi:RNA polymerase sigma factor (sigma-70 family)